MDEKNRVCGNDLGHTGNSDNTKNVGEVVAGIHEQNWHNWRQNKLRYPKNVAKVTLS